MFRSVSVMLLAAGLATVSSIAAGQQQTEPREQSPQQTLGSFFGPQLLTEEEQAAYRARIRKAKTPQEGEAVRAEHYELMKVRAREKGIALPEQRPPVGGSQGNSFGPQLTTEEERAAYRARIRSARTREAFGQIRSEQHEAIETRAREEGIVLPEAPAVVTGSSGNAVGGSGSVAGSSPGVFGALFGPQLMTEEEQMAYRARLRAARTPEEREKLRDEHRRQLQARAKAKGVVLP